MAAGPSTSSGLVGGGTPAVATEAPRARLVYGSAAIGPAIKRARFSVMVDSDDDVPKAVWQVCAAPASKCGRLGAAWIDLPEPWASHIEVMFQGVQEMGEVWRVVAALAALGPEALPKVTDGGDGAAATREVIFIHGGGIVMRCIASGTERAMRRLEYVYGAKVGSVVKVEVVD
jgi:hypothetical protein